MSRSAPRPQVVAHRPKREERKTRELADIKRENNQLRRTVAKLQREIERLELTEAPDLEPREADPAALAVKCEKCGSENTSVITTPSGKKVIGCKDCASRIRR